MGDAGENWVNKKMKTNRHVKTVGLWGKDDPRRIFVEGAKWWEFHKTGFTAWPSDVDEMEEEAIRRFGGGVMTHNIVKTPASWYVKTDDGPVKHEDCQYRYVQTSNSSGSVTTNWHACGHPAATGMPCVYWGCPICAQVKESL